MEIFPFNYLFLYFLLIFSVAKSQDSDVLETEYFEYKELALRPNWNYDIYNSLKNKSAHNMERQAAFNLFGFKIIQQDSLEGVIGITKKDTIIPVCFDRCDYLYNDYWLVRKKGKLGIWKSEVGLIGDTIYRNIRKHLGYWRLYNDSLNLYFLGDCITEKKILKSIGRKRYETPFHLIYLYTENGKYGAMNSKGVISLPPSFNRITEQKTSENEKDLKIICLRNDSSFVFNTDLNEEFRISYKIERYLSSTYLIIALGEQLMVYDRMKNSLFEDFAFTNLIVKSHKKFIAEHESKKKVSLIELDESGNAKFILPFIYDSLEVLSTNEIFVCLNDSSCGIVNYSEEIIIPLNYGTIEKIGSYFRVTKNGKFGLLSGSNVVLLPCIFDKLYPYKNGFQTMQRINNKRKIVTYDANLTCVENCN